MPRFLATPAASNMVDSDCDNKGSWLNSPFLTPHIAAIGLIATLISNFLQIIDDTSSLYSAFRD
ncbi:MAG: hypothetical protein CM15mP71_6930 [Candidatus Poseidoniales archaeon]|nr:MAG: hypothetical protein CM15mP71_6930 [Candidatus Poseidoniales archaeon]